MYVFPLLPLRRATRADGRPPAVGVIDVLVAHGADIDDDIGHGYTPLIDACLMKDFDSACELIDRGADVNIEFHAAPPRISEDPIIAKFTGRGVRPIGMSNLCCLSPPVQVVSGTWCCPYSRYAPDTAVLILKYS